MQRRQTFCLVLLIFIVGTQSSLMAQQPFWVTAYYPSWAETNTSQGGMPLWNASLTGITHLVRFCGWTSQKAPYVFPMVSANDSIEFEYHGISNSLSGPSSWTNWQDSCIVIAHRNNVKVVLSSDNHKADLDFISADSERTETCARILINYLKRKGYDGLEVDWEPPSNTNDCSRLLRRLRLYLDQMTPKGILMIAPGNGKNYATLFDASLCNDICDQINIQLYGYAPVWWSGQTSPPGPSANVTWYTSPLYRGKLIPLSEAAAWDTWGPNQWASIYGFSKNKLGAGMPFYGWNYRKHTGPGEVVSSPVGGYVDHYTYIAQLIANGGTKHWDDASKVPYLTGTAINTLGPTYYGAWGVLAGEKFWTSYEDSQSVAEKTKWAKANSLGGIMIYDMSMDFDATKPIGKRQPLLSSVVNALTLASVTIDRVGNEIPKSFSLDQNYPNPFDPTMVISYSISQRTNAKLTIFNSLGKTIAVLVDGVQEPGKYKVTFDSSAFGGRTQGTALGIYYYRLETEKYSETKKLLLLK